MKIIIKDVTLKNISVAFSALIDAKGKYNKTLTMFDILNRGIVIFCNHDEARKFGRHIVALSVAGCSIEINNEVEK